MLRSLSAPMSRPKLVSESVGMVLAGAHIVASTSSVVVFGEEVIADGEMISREKWDVFDHALRHAVVPARVLVPELGELFQRKTFNEPIHQCADQAWLARYEGARTTRETLGPHLERIRRACADHERGLFEMLLSELDAYGMAIQALLLTPREFRLGTAGELEMDSGIRTCCEDRRLAIRSLAGRLLRPPDDPLLPESVWFMAAGTNEERKMIIHGLEGRIRREREETYEDVFKGSNRKSAIDGALEKLTGEFLRKAMEREAAADESEEQRRPACPRGRETADPDVSAATPKPTAKEAPTRLLRFRESSWDLDRIYCYLLVQYFDVDALRWEANGTSVVPDQPTSDTGSGGSTSADEPPLNHDLFCAARDVEMEIERYRARAKGGSLTPLTYALVALQTLKPSRAASVEQVRIAVTGALALVRDELAEILRTDEGRPIARLLADIWSEREFRV